MYFPKMLKPSFDISNYTCYNILDKGQDGEKNILNQHVGGNADTRDTAVGESRC